MPRKKHSFYRLIQNLKSIDKNDHRESNDVMIRQGFLNQSNSFFISDSRGMQCTPIALVALCFSVIKNLTNWTSKDIDQVIIIGDLLYNMSKRHLRSLNKPTDFNYFSFDLVYPNVIINKHHCTITEDFRLDENTNTICHVQQSLFCSEELLKNALLTFFQKSYFSKGIFTLNEYSHAVWFHESFYYTFNSHGAFGSPVQSQDGAVLIKVTNVDELSLTLLKNSGLGTICGNTLSIPFTLTSIRVNIEENIDLNVQELQNLENSRIATKRYFENETTLQRSSRYERKKISNKYSPAIFEVSPKKMLMKKKQDCNRKKLSLSYEATEMRNKRLTKLKNQRMIRLSLQTEQERQQNLLKRKQDYQKKSDSEDNLKKRQKLDSTRNERLANETPLQMVKNQNKKKFSYASKIQNESFQDREERLKKMRERKALLAMQNSKQNLEKVSFGELKNIFKLNTTKEIIVTKAIDSTTDIDVRLQTEIIIDKILYHRNKTVDEFCKYFLSLQTILEAVSTKVKSFSNFEGKFSALTGPSQHTKNSDLYFCTKRVSNNNPLILDINGKVHSRSENESKTGTWICDDYCNINKKYILDRMVSLIEVFLNLKPELVLPFFNNIDCCSNKIFENSLTNHCDGKLENLPDNYRKLPRGHSIVCYSDESCNSILLFFRTLSAHFPLYRQITRTLYKILRSIQFCQFYTSCINRADLNELKEISKELTIKSSSFVFGKFPYKEEKDVMDCFATSFRELRKKELDLPVNVCISCLKLCFLRSVRKIDSLKIENNIHWENLIQNKNNCIYICLYCANKFKEGKLPPTCILNNLNFGKKPNCIECLNDFEKVLIQRAKAFQIITRMDTVSGGHNKNNPRASLQKIRGRTFHLPLPIEETLKKLPAPTEPIIKDQDVFLLVRSLPNQQNKVWQSLVSINKVYEALKWLKENNPLYQQIILPNNAEDLLKNIPDCDIQTNASINNEIIDAGSKERKGMLTQKSETDPYYENLTIYPLNEPRMNMDSSTIYQFIKVISESIDERDPLLDVKCFPDLFYLGKFGINEKRCEKLSHSEFIKTVLMSSNAQFRLNIQYLFYLLNNSNLRQIRAGIFQKLFITANTSSLKAEQCLNMIKNRELEGNLSTVFSRLRNTKQYWSHFRNDLNAMVNSYGPATFFLTLSPSEYHWDDLHSYLCLVNNIQIKNRSLPYLVALDPVSTSRFIDNKFQAMLNFLTCKNGPLGEVVHYAWRREYQSRGLQHFHMVLWIKNAKTIGESSPEEVAEFISKYITCHLPCKENFPTLHYRVIKYQTHYHNTYCMRAKKTKSGKVVKVCRFSFPREVTENLTVNDVSDAIVGRTKLTKKRLYSLPRTAMAVNINDYNPAILLAWCGNVDLQFIGEKSSSLTTYITKYQTKAEKSFATEDFQDITSTKPLVTRLFNFAMRALNNRECGALEAADTLLQLPLFGTDNLTVIRWLDVRINRFRKLKDRTTLEKLNSNSSEIFYPNWIEDHYPNRPTPLESSSLYEFSSWFDIVKIKPKNTSVIWYPYHNSYLRKRKSPYIINHYQFNQRQEPEKYFYSLLLLFKPWRQLSSLKLENQTYKEAFLSIKDSLSAALKYEEKFNKIFVEKETVQKEVDQKINNLEKNGDTGGDQLFVEIIPIDKEISEFDKVLEQCDLNYLLKQMNLDQKKVFDEVISTLELYLADISKMSNLNGNNVFINEKQLPSKVLRKFVSGVGGTGKSFLINIIRLYVTTILKKQVIVTAPTGIAAYNVNGITIHRLLQLPIEHDSIPAYTKLSDDKLNSLRAELKNCILIIVDEISMVSNIMFMYIHLRLSEIFDTTEIEDGWFGRVNLLLLGDLLQLSPVKEGSPFVDIPQKKAFKYFSSILTVNVWKELLSYNELNINVRQSSDPYFSKILSCVRLGVLSEEHEKKLREREIELNTGTNTVDNLALYIEKLPENTICLLPTKKICNELNKAMLSQLRNPLVVLKADDEIEAKTFAQKESAKKSLQKIVQDDTKTAGLETNIEVKIGCKVMLLRNIDVTTGLVNGSIGTLEKINSDPITKQAKTITIRFMFGTHELEPVKSKFQVVNNVYIIRKQFPICLAFGITIHKSQGLTIESCVVEIGDSIFTSGQAYVALSRVKSLNGLHIINLNPKNIKAQKEAINEYNRLKSHAGLQNLIKYPENTNRNMNDKNVYVSKYTREGHIEPDMAVTLQKRISVHNLKKITNSDNVSCYANASMQCLFNLNMIVMLIKSGPQNVLKSIFNTYIKATHSESVSLKILREEFEQFAVERQQDASEFLYHIFEKYSYLKSAVECTKTTKYLCLNCSYENVEYEKLSIVPLYLPVDRTKSFTINDIFIHNFDNTVETDKACSKCKGHLLVTKINIMDPPEVLILSFQLGEMDKSKKCLIKVQNLRIIKSPTTIINLGGFKYRLHSAIFHHGTEIGFGHYTAIVKQNNNWFRVNDEVVTNCSWPRNSHDIYVMFYIKESK